MSSCGRNGDCPASERCVFFRRLALLESNRFGGNAVSSFPAIAFPGGFSIPTNSAPLGVPLGIELLGPDWSEPVLIKLAYAFEQAAKIRRPPPSTPPLP